jgi:ABC-type lipoprotein release transport system permease subunit
MNKQMIAHIIGRIVFYLKDIILHFPSHAVKAFHTLVIFGSFFIILVFFMISLCVKMTHYVPGLSFLMKKLEAAWDRTAKGTYLKIYEKLEDLRPFKIKRRYLVFVAFQNLNMRKSRSLITIIGMSVGVGIIVYLLSLGYGIEKLVISQVASLEELQMVDVSSGESSTASLSKAALQKIKKIAEVKEVIPMISVVGRLNFNNAKTDILVYAVPKSYLEASRPDMVTGKYFSQKDVDILGETPEVAGETVTVKKATYGTPLTRYKVFFALLPKQEVAVWSDCTIKAKIIGTTVRTESTLEGMEFWGSEYAPFQPYGRESFDKQKNEYLGRWIKGEFPLFEHKSETELAEKIGIDGVQEWKFGCVQAKHTQIVEEIRIRGEVLGEATESATLTASASASLAATDSADLDASASADLANSDYANATVATSEAGVEVISMDKKDQPEKKEQTLQFKSKVSGEAVISTALLNLLNIPREKATSTDFKISFIIIRSLMPSIQGRILTEEVEYKVVGVVDDDENQFIYIPIQDINVLGVTNYSQAKLLVTDQKYLPEVRHSVETLGYKTASTADTIEQIETFFTGLRGVLGVLGFIALGVASLGMFNTLTVSLLERTREIGGMKTMGMVSGEIQELFLAEAMIMGFSGGIGGILLGFFVGKMSSYIISIIAISQGVGYLELTYVPFSLILFIILSSFVVGLVTGLYPSYRAKKISALNALRYE